MYLIFKAFHEDIDASYIWCNTVPRGYYKLKHGKHSIIVKVRHIDSSFERYFNSKRSYELPKEKQLIVMSEHYRDLLNLHISEDRNRLYNIEITPIRFWAGLRAAKYTPNEFIQLSVNLAILSVIISLLPLAKPFVVPILNFLIFVLTLIVNFL